MKSSVFLQDKINEILDHFSSGKIQETLDALDRLAIDFPSEALLFNIRGACYCELGKFEKGIENYLKSISIDKNYAKAHYNLAVAYSEIKKNDCSIIYYKKALQINPKNPEALNNIGHIYKELNQYDEAIESFQKAISYNPGYAEANYSLGITYQNQGKLEEALKCFLNVAQIKPDFAEIHNNISIIFYELDNFDLALQHLNCALSIDPNFAEAHYNLGNLFKDLGKFEKAIRSYKMAIEVNKNYSEAYFNLGNIQIEMGDLEESVESYTKALLINPNFLEVLNNLGSVYKDLNQLDDSLQSLKKALALNPEYLDALNNVGLTYVELGLTELAIDAYRKAISIDSKYEFAYNNLGIALNLLYQYDEAQKYFEKALQLQPNYFDAHVNYANLMIYFDNFNKALISYERAMELNPNADYIYGDIIHTKMYLCMWNGLPNYLKKLHEKIENGEKVIGPFALSALSDDPETIFSATKLYRNDKFPKSNILPQIPQYPYHKKIQIGYFSADFRDHPVSTLTVELYEKHDRSKFEVHAFSYGPDTKDDLNLRIKSGVDHFHNVRTMSDKDIVLLSRSLEIDIAVDLGGFTENARARVFAMSSAPIQLSYIGYLGTMGASYYDYLVADTTIIPEESQRYYSEKIIYLPHFQANDSKQSYKPSSFSRKDLDLPENSFVFCCFNKNYKYTPECFDSWARILENVENSVLFIFVSNKTAEINLKKEIVNRGINKSRLIFGKKLERAEYLGRLKIADLFLDTYPYNAGATSSDALRVGLPVLTRLGNSFASRMGASILRSINLPELITKTQKEYELLAIELATNPNRLKFIKNTLNSNLSSSPLFDTQLFTKNIESAYKIIYERYHNKQNQKNIYIDNLE
jgi:protein O-GlcNAc transferase